MKRFLIILLIVFIVFNSVNVPEVYAVGNMIIDNPFNRQLIATMIIASGMVFTSTKQLEDSVTSFIDMWNDHETGWTMPTPKDPQGPNTWEAIIYGAIAAGSVAVSYTHLAEQWAGKEEMCIRDRNMIEELETEDIDKKEDMDKKIQELKAKFKKV